MIALAILAALMPPAGPDQIDWDIQAADDYAPVARTCVATAGEVRAAVMKVGASLFTPDQLKAWLASKSFTTSRDGERFREWPLEARTGTYVIVTYRNRRYDLSSPAKEPAALWRPCSGFRTGGNNLP